MNRNRYRLVFDAERGMLVPVCEHLPARSKRGGGKAVAAIGAAVLLGVAGGAIDDAHAGGALRVAAPSSASANPAAIVRPPVGYVPPESAFSSADGRYARTAKTAANGETYYYGQVDQAVQRAIFNWTNFDIGSGGHVHFNQPDNGSAINRIVSANPSVIMGMLTATGQIYLINQNGVIFGYGARVDVGSLVASSLDIKDSVFRSENGWFSLQSSGGKLQNPTFCYNINFCNSEDTGDYTAQDLANISSGKSFVRVEQGAELNAAKGQGIYIFAPRIENAGKISTPEGQTILAAGAKVYLSAPNEADTRLRGFLVEVEPYKDGSGNNIGGSVSIERLGQVLAERGGNITIAGLAVNHAGKLRTTTTVDANGSIIIQARDTAVVGDQKLVFGKPLPAGTEQNPVLPRPVSSRGGSLTIEPGSQIEIAPEAINVTDDKGRVSERLRPDNAQANASWVYLAGGDLAIGGQIAAPSGKVELLASSGRLDMMPLSTDQGFITIGSSGAIDVSGLKNVEAPLDRNIISLELRGDELKDSPLLRSGPLAGKKVKVDLRKGSTIANLLGYIKTVQRGINENSAFGGTVSLQAADGVLMQQGSLIDVSGGTIRYQDGTIGVSRLKWARGSDSITTASSLQPYTDVFEYQFREKGYLEGRDAGSITIAAKRVALAGTLAGTATAGPNQRQTVKKNSGPYAIDQYTTMATAVPLGGTLKLTGDVESVSSDGTQKYKSLNQHVLFASGTPDVSKVLDRDSLPRLLQMDPDMLTRGGFSSINVNASGGIDVAGGTRLAVQPGGSIVLTGAGVVTEKVTVTNAQGNPEEKDVSYLSDGLHIDGTLAARGGSITLENKGSESEGKTSPQIGDIAIGAGGRLDVSGLFTNDLQTSRGALPTGRIQTGGGSVIVTAAHGFALAAGAVIDASAGGYLAPSKKGLASTPGDAGSITLSTGVLGVDEEAAAATATMTLAGELRAFAGSYGNALFGKGGTLDLTTSSIHIGGSGSGKTGELQLGEDFFKQGGFKDFSLDGRDQLIVASGTHIEAQPVARVIEARNARNLNDDNFAALAPLQTATAEWRSPGTISLKSSSPSGGARSGAYFGSLKIGEGAEIVVDPQGTVNLSARNEIQMSGKAIAPGGTINLSIAGAGDFEAPKGALWSARTIWLTPNAQLLAAGVVKHDPRNTRRLAGDVLNGGQISVDAKGGYLVTQAGSLIDASGTSATLDRHNRAEGQGYASVPVSSAGGSITLAASEGLLLDGAVSARAGDTSVAGGSLRVSFNRVSPAWSEQGQNGDPVLKAYLDRERTLSLAGSVAAATTGMTAGGALDTAKFNGVGMVAVDQVKAGGFSSLSLASVERIELAGSVDLSLSGALTLAAPNLSAKTGARVALNAGQISLQGDISRALRKPATGDSAAAGNKSQVALSGDQVDVAGYMTTQGIDRLVLSSRGDLRLRGRDEQSDGRLKGELAVGGYLDINAAQVFPTSMSDFELAVHNNDAGTITFGQPQSRIAVGPVLSGAGTLTVSAPTIVQGGVLKAPFGQIALKADKIIDTTGQEIRTRATGGSVTLSENSETSVSGAGLEVLLGNTTLSGREWQYNGKTVTALPEKAVTLAADQVLTRAGAKIDLSGGGELKAWEFTPGRGGSQDVLDSKTGIATNVYAILPTLGNAYAPYDEQIYANSTAPGNGDRIKLLTAAGGLPAGEYTLLPARYALLPGAYTVTIKSAQDGVSRSVAQPDGSVLLSAVKTSAVAGGGSVGRDGAIYQVQVATADVARLKSAYTETYASRFFGNGRSSGDAGRLAIDAGSRIELEATIASTFAAGHRGAELDVAAKNLAIVGEGETAQAGQVGLQADKLASVNAESILLGGLRRRNSDGSINVDVVAETVDIGTGNKTVTVKAGEVLVAASSAAMDPKDPQKVLGQVTVHTGASIEGDVTRASAGEVLKIDNRSGTGDGVLLRVAGGGQSTLLRPQELDNRNVVLALENGSRISGNSLIIDSTNKTLLAGTVNVGESATVGSKRISVGGGNGDDGIRFNADLFQQIGSPKNLNLTSYSSIDLYGGANLGAVGLRELTLQAAGIAGYDIAGQPGQTATIQADVVRLNNPSGSAFAANGNGTGTLVVQAGQVEFGQGSTTIQGFSTVNVNAGEEIRLAGSSRQGDGTLTGHLVKGNLNLAAPRIGAATGTDQALRAEGALTTARIELAAGKTLAAAGQGARIELSGKSVTHGGYIELPAGEVSLAAKGGNVADGVELLQGSAILAKGFSRDFLDVNVAYPAGTVLLSSDNGSVTVDSGALVDVSGVGAGHAGSIEVAATKGSFNMAGELRGKAVNGATQGSFKADAQSLGNLNALNAALNSGGLTESRDFRQRSGDVVLGTAGATNGGDVFVAHNFALAADNGSINVYNTIDARGDKGGRIELYANNGDLVLNSSARMDARATKVLARESGTEGQGGDVLLGTMGTNKAVVVKEGAAIAVDAAPGSAARGGSVNFRAERTNAKVNNVAQVASVRFDAIAGSAKKLADAISGASNVAVEGVKKYDLTGQETTLVSGTANTGSSLGFSTVMTDNNSDFSAVNISALADRLGFVDNATTAYFLRPGVEVRSTGNLTVNNAWDLSLATSNSTKTRYGNSTDYNAGVLTLRAAGTLSINADIKDGLLVQGTGVNQGYYLPTSGDSWSYRLVGGADGTGANPLATVRNGVGDVNVAKVSVTSATGNIAIAAAQDIALLDKDSVVLAGGYQDTASAAVLKSQGTWTVGTAKSDRIEFAKNGGDIRLSAGRDIYSVSPTDTSDEAAGDKDQTAWLGRSGATSPGKVSAWWVASGAFKQGFGALAGDITATAGRNVVNAAFVAPSTGYVASGSILKEFGGGDVSVVARNNVDGTLVMSGKGQVVVEAGGAIGSTDPTGTKNYSKLLVGDAALSAFGRWDVAIDKIGLEVIPYRNATTPIPYGNYFVFTDRSSVTLISAAGDASLNLKAQGSLTSPVTPPTLRAIAMNGDVRVGEYNEKNQEGTGGFKMTPAASGQLELLAAGDVVVKGRISMSDAATVSTPLNPLSTLAGAENSLNSHDPSLLHRDDSQPLRVVAGGDIQGIPSDTSLVTAKAFRVVAGGNIQDFAVTGQNLRTNDVSQVVAGGDIRFTTSPNSGTPSYGYLLGGPGQLHVVAGGSIDLANSLGIVTNGNLSNAYLASEGASIMVLAGAQGMDWQTFLTVPAYRDKLFAVLRDAGREAATRKSAGDKNYQDAYAKGYAALAEAFPGTPALLPAVGSAMPSVPYKGNLDMFYSQIKTLRGGGIDLLVPGGEINVGLASIGGATKHENFVSWWRDQNQVDSNTRKASDLGILTIQGKDDIRTYSLGSLWVNQSRVFTLGGGSILLWSSYGDIDAGNGAKTAAAAPPPLLRWDSKSGSFVVDASNSISGSGIGVLLGRSDVVAGDVDLYAPIGTINAGDAGIRSSGKIYVGGIQVIGADNIVGANVVGAPPPPPPPPVLTGVANAAVEANRSGEQDTQAGSRRKSGGDQQSLLNVEILSLGEDGAGAGGSSASGPGDDKKKRN